MLNGNSKNNSMVAAVVNLLSTANHSGAAFESEPWPYLNDLYQTAFHMLQQSAKASSAVETTYLRAWKVFGNYRPDTNWRTGLFQILVDVVRHERRNIVGRRHETTLPHGSNAPSHSVSAMNLVPVDLMDALLLVDGQGFSYREAGEILGLSIDVVAHRVVLGRNRLHLELEACGSTSVAVAK
jgi:DNA-directed RNA polymerase specialized sigma24 family protein